MTARRPELDALRSRMTELSDLHSVGALLFCDQQTVMPPAGAQARASARRRSRVIHARECDPALGALLDAPEPWAERGPGLR